MAGIEPEARVKKGIPFEKQAIQTEGESLFDLDFETLHCSTSQNEDLTGSVTCGHNTCATCAYCHTMGCITKFC